MSISRVIAAIALLIIALSVIAFVVLNPGERVAVNLGWRSYTNVPMVVTLFIAFAIGIVLAFVYCLYYFVDLGLTVRRLKKKNRSLEKELVAIRNLPLEESPEESGREEGKEVAP